MLARRDLIHAGFAGACAACATFATNPLSHALAAAAAAPAEIDGRGYKLWFVGGQRETIMAGKRDALLDLRTIKNRSRVYGIGPIEGLGGEVTIVNSRPSLARVDADRRVHVEQTYEAGVPFFVWAEVPGWTDVMVPAQLRTYADLEAFIAKAGQEAGLTQAFPFVVAGRPTLIDFHVLDARPDTPPGPAAHQKIQIPFEVHDQDATLVGFWSNQHQGIFTPMGTKIHIHFQTADNKASGHVQGLDLGQSGMTLRLPKE